MYSSKANRSFTLAWGSIFKKANIITIRPVQTGLFF
jgi:hypothetical protein